MTPVKLDALIADVKCGLAINRAEILSALYQGQRDAKDAAKWRKLFENGPAIGTLIGSEFCRKTVEPIPAADFVAADNEIDLAFITEEIPIIEWRFRMLMKNCPLSLADAIEAAIASEKGERT